MGIISWKERVATAVGAEQEPAPDWDGNSVPHCSEACPNHDVKRCYLTGMRHGDLCYPVVEAMAAQLDKDDG